MKHRIDWDSATCITYSTDYYQRLNLESLVLFSKLEVAFILVKAVFTTQLDPRPPPAPLPRHRRLGVRNRKKGSAQYETRMKVISHLFAFYPY